jgi:hypothetical protein
MVLRTEKPQALYVALEKNSRFYKLTSRREGGKNDTKQNKHQKLQNAGSVQSIRAQNKTILWDAETKVKKRKKERKKEEEEIPYPHNSGSSSTEVEPHSIAQFQCTR